jgi:hypothetical protein
LTELTQLRQLLQQFRSAAFSLCSRRAPKLVLLTFFIVAVLLYFVPWQPHFPSVGEGSYAFALRFATEHRLTYGRDIVYTFGPAAPYLMSTYFAPAQFLGMVILNALLYGLFAVVISTLLVDLPIHHVFILCASFFYALNLTWDIAFFAFPLLFALAATSTLPHCGGLAALLILPACAVATLYKGTYAFLAISLIVLTDLYLVVVRREIRLYSLVYIFLCVLSLAFVGQPWTSLPLLLKGYYQIASAYSEAMQLQGPEIEIYAFLASQAFVGACLLIFVRELRASERVFILGSFAIVSFFIWKAGFVRHDVHVTQAYSGSLFLTCLTASLLGTKHRSDEGSTIARVGYRVSLAGVVVMIALVGIGMVRIHNRLDQRDLAGAFVEKAPERARGFANFWRAENYSELSRTMEDTLARIREESPLPKLNGSVDVIPVEQSVLLAHRAQYQPRPVFQNYQVNSAPLLSRNSAFWESDRAPEYVLFFFPPDAGFGNIWLNEGATWPALLARYDLVDFQAPHFVLKKRAFRRNAALRTLETREVLLGQRIPLPQSVGITLASIRIRRTLLGEVATTLYKIPLPTMTAHLVDGSSQTSGIITNSATAPFVVSTFIDSAANFAGLFLGFEKGDVDSFELNLPPGSGRLWYEAHATVDFSSLELGTHHQDVEIPMVGHSVRGLMHLLELSQNSDVRDGRKRLIVLEPRPGLPQLHLLAPVPSRSWLRPTGERLQIAFGMADARGTTASVTFKISALMTGGALRVLWSRTVRAGAVETDRGRQTAEVVLPKGSIERIQLETLENEGSASPWPYWTDILFSGSQ